MTENENIKNLINEIVERIVKEYHPNKVILFRSYAYGNPKDDSIHELLSSFNKC